MTEEIKCYLYWIRTEEMTDIFTEGYVGITHNPDYRYQQHKSNAKTNSHHKYKKAFRKALLEGRTILEIQLISTVEYCLDIERKLRPYINVAWNRAIGGDGGYNYKHGLTGSKCKGAYYNMLIRAQEQCSTVCEEWLGEDALEIFCSFYTDRIVDDKVMYTTNLTHISPETVIFKTRQEVIAERFRVHDLYGDGVLYNLNEVAEIFSMKPNTIASNICRGWTVRQAVGLDEKPKRVVEIKDKVLKPYSGKLTDEQIVQLKTDFENGITLTNLAETYGIDHGNMSRLVRRFGFERKHTDSSTDFFGEVFSITRLSKLDSNGFEVAKDMLLQGIPRYKIAEVLGISGSTMTDVCSKLKWKEYLSEQKSLGFISKNLEDTGGIYELLEVGNTQKFVEPQSN